MTAEYEYSTPLVQRAIDEIANATLAIEEATNLLEKTCEQKLATWQGEARSMYWTAKAQWEAEIREMKELLAKSGTTLGSVSEAYELAEKRAAGNWSSFGGF